MAKEKLEAVAFGYTDGIRNEFETLIKNLPRYIHLYDGIKNLEEVRSDEVQFSCSIA